MGSFKRLPTLGDASGKPKRARFNCNEVGHYSKDCPKPKPNNGGFKVIGLTTNLAQSEPNCLIFLKGEVYKYEVLCLFDIGVFPQLHNLEKC